MTISDYQIGSVIRTYMKNMKVRVDQVEKRTDNKGTKEDEVSISAQGMKRMLYDRIGEQMTEKLKKYDQE